MTRLTADDTRALMALKTHAERHALAWQITEWPDGTTSCGLHPPDALHSRALAHGVGQDIAEAVREAMAQQKELQQ